jgi:RNA polymerase sigma factor for flagellar operon FliA
VSHAHLRRLVTSASPWYALLSEVSPDLPEAVAETAEAVALWQRFEERQESETRAHLIERYLPLSRMIAASLYSKRIAHDAEFADYMQYATLGLIEAVDSFDWRRGVSFNTFAGYRIQGSVRNHLTSFSEHREQAGLLYRLKKERAESIKLGDGAPVKQRRSRTRLLHEMADVTVIWALSHLLEGSGMLAPHKEPHYLEQFYDSVELRQLKEKLVNLVDALPVQERRVIKYHYFQNLEFAEVAGTLGLTKSRISQVHKNALILLREAYAIAGGLDLKF